MPEGVAEEVHGKMFQTAIAKDSSQAPSPCRGDTSAQGLRECGPLAEIVAREFVIKGSKQMKRVNFMVISIAFIILLSACANKIETKTTIDKNLEGQSNISSNIIVNSDVTISNNDLYNFIGKNEYLRLKMIMGEYSEDWTPGPLSGPKWEGIFEFDVYDQSGNLLKKTSLNDSYGFSDGQISFSGQFNLEFDDYNNDGDIDFTIGQYASSIGRYYRLFTLRKDGRVEELKIDDAPFIYVSSATGYYSTKFEKIDNLSFKTKLYNRSNGKYEISYFKWTKDKFKLQKTELIDN